MSKETKKILVIDEDQSVRSMMLEQLVAANFEAIAVGSPREALELLQRSPESYGALVVDYKKTNTDSIALIREAFEQKIVPSQVIVTSSSIVILNDTLGHLKQDYPSVVLMQKAFDVKDLVDILQKKKAQQTDIY